MKIVTELISTTPYEEEDVYKRQVLQRAAVTPPRRRPTFIVKDVRLFLNTIRRSMGIMQRAGVDAACEREEDVYKRQAPPRPFCFFSA